MKNTWVPDIYFIHAIRRIKIRGFQGYDYFSNPSKMGEYRLKSDFYRATLCVSAVFAGGAGTGGGGSRGTCHPNSD